VPFILSITILHLKAETNLSGTLEEMILDQQGNPYVIDENITIPFGKKISIREGCVLLFKPFSGIIVEGSLEVLGSEEKPVIFTSINDSQFYSQSTQSAEPFDWNGILITIQARNVQLSNFILMYSVYGIKSQVDDIKVKSGIFSNNGQFHFTIKDAIQQVSENLPYTYGIELTKTDTLQLKTTGKSSKRILSFALFTTGIVGFGGMAYSLYEIPVYHKKYENAKTQVQRNNHFDKQIFFRNTAIISGTTGAVLVSLGVFSLFKNKSDNKHVSLIPYFPCRDYSGICITMGY
jgi:hypothetical protein